MLYNNPLYEYLEHWIWFWLVTIVRNQINIGMNLNLHSCHQKYPIKGSKMDRGTDGQRDRCYVLIKHFGTVQVVHLSWQLRHSRNCCNIILWGNSNHQSYVYWKFLFLPPRFLLKVSDKITETIPTDTDVFCEIKKTSLVTLLFNKRSTFEGVIFWMLSDTWNRNLSLWQLELHQRITLQSLQRADSKTLVRINNLHSKTRKYEAHALKNGDYPLT